MRYLLMAACLTLGFAACGGDGGDNPGNDGGNDNNDDEDDDGGNDDCTLKYGFADGQTHEITIDTTWENGPSDCDVLVDSLSLVSGKLTIEPGVVVKFTQDAVFSVNDGGSIDARGTAEAHITFRGLADVDGYAVGVYLMAGSHESWFDYVDFRNLGNENISGLEPGGALGGQYGGGVHITNCTVERSRINGLTLEYLPLLEFANNAFNDNDGAGLLVAAHQIALLDTTSDYVGTQKENGLPYIVVNGIFDDESIKEDTTIVPLNAPFYVYNVAYLQGGTTTMMPGVQWVFEEGGSFNVDDGATLVIEGTPETRVRFSGYKGAAWDGISFYEGFGTLTNLDLVNAYIGLDVGSGSDVTATNVNFGDSSVGVCVDQFSSASLEGGSIDGGAPAFVSYLEDEELYDEHC